MPVTCGKSARKWKNCGKLIFRNEKELDCMNKAETAAYFDALAPGWDDHMVTDDDKLRAILDAAGRCWSRMHWLPLWIPGLRQTFKFRTKKNTLSLESNVDNPRAKKEF